MHFDLLSSSVSRNTQENMKSFLVLLAVSACLVVANGTFRGTLKDFLDRGPTRVRVEQPKKSIAVMVNGGDQDADSVAGKCGVINQGQVAKAEGIRKSLTEEAGGGPNKPT